MVKSSRIFFNGILHRPINALISLDSFTCIRVFHKRLTSGKRYNNRPLFKNNRLLFSYRCLKMFVGDKALMEGTKS